MADASEGLRAVVGATIDLVLPRRCVGCAVRGTPWCPPCRDAARRPVRRSVSGCPVWAGGAYVDPLRTALIEFKEHGRRDLARPLAGLLRDALARLPGGTVAVPVPISATARRARGFDQVRTLARRCGRAVWPVLAIDPGVSESVGLGRIARAGNLAGAMSVRAGPPAGRARCVVLDDVVTTGATLTEAFRALACAGWQPVGAAVVAHVAHTDHTEC